MRFQYPTEVWAAEVVFREVIFKYPAEVFGDEVKFPFQLMLDMGVFVLGSAVIVLSALVDEWKMNGRVLKFCPKGAFDSTVDASNTNDPLWNVVLPEFGLEAVELNKGNGYTEVLTSTVEVVDIYRLVRVTFPTSEGPLEGTWVG